MAVESRHKIATHLGTCHNSTAVDQCKFIYIYIYIYIYIRYNNLLDERKRFEIEFELRLKIVNDVRHFEMNTSNR